MRTAFGLHFYPWDFTGGADSLLDRALGEVGFDALIVPAVTGPLERFRIEPDQPPHTFATEGGWHFPVKPESFQGCAVKPRVAKWCGKRDVLDKIQKFAAQRGLQLILEVNPRAVSGLLEHEPHLRCRDAWGDVHSAAGACVMNADLRELLRATLANLAQYEPAGWQLANWMTDLPPDDLASSAFSWHAALPRLLNVCFCPACRQVAAMEGVDPDAVAETVRRLTAGLMQEPERDFERLPTGNLREYVEIRRRDAVRWLGRLKESFPGRRFYLKTEAWSPADSWLAPRAAFQALRDEFTLVFTPVVTASAATATFAAGRSESRVAIPPPEIGEYGLVLPVWRPEIRQGDELVKLVTAAVQGEAPRAGEVARPGEASRLGPTLLEFEGLDAAPRVALDWLRHAVRYARRG